MILRNVISDVVQDQVEGVLTNRRRGGFNPLKLTNPLFFSDSISNPSSNQANDLISGSLKTGRYLKTNSSETTSIACGNIGSVKAIEFWVKLESTTESLFDLNGTANIEVSSGTITVNNWSGTSIEVDGSAGSTLDTDWHHVYISSSTSVSASSFIIGLINASYGDFSLKDLVLYEEIPSSSNYSTPQSLLGLTALATYPCSEGFYLNGYPLFDYSGNGKDGAISTTSDMAQIGASVGYQSGLAGSNKYAVLSGADVITDIDGIANGETFSITFSVFFTTLNSQNYIMGTEGSSLNLNTIEIRSNGIVFLNLGGGTSGTNAIRWSSSGVQAGKWHDVTITWDGVDASCVFDSVTLTPLDSSPSSPVYNTSKLVFGDTRTSASVQPFNGILRNISISKDGSEVANYKGTLDFNNRLGALDRITVNTTDYVLLDAGGDTDIYSNSVDEPKFNGLVNNNQGLGFEIGDSSDDIGTSTAYTIAGAFRYHTRGSVQIIANNQSDLAANGVRIRIETSGKVTSRNNSSNVLTSEITTQPDIWYYFAYTNNGSDGKLYLSPLDYVRSFYEVEGSGTLQAGTSIFMFGNGLESSVNQPLDGLVIYPVVYQSVLTISQIGQLQSFTLSAKNSAHGDSNYSSFINSGQSNSVSYNNVNQTTSAGYYLGYIDNVEYYNYSTDLFELIENSTNTFAENGYGVEHQISKSLSDQGYNVRFLKHAEGGTAIVGGEWDPDADVGDNHDEELISLCKESGFYYQKLIWIQGEADTSQNQEVYAAKLTTLLNKFKNNILGLETIYVVQLPDFNTAPNIKAAQAQVATALDFVTLVVPRSGITQQGDDTHYDAQGINELAFDILTSF